MSDMCENARFCNDIALPGRDLCGGCQADADSERAVVEAAARALTAEHELSVEQQEAAA